MDYNIICENITDNDELVELASMSLDCHNRF